MFTQNLKIAWRSLIKDRQFTILNLLGLSTGLVAAILVYLWVSDEIRVDKFHEKDDRLFRVVHHIKLPEGVQTLDVTPSPLAEALKKELPEVEVAVAVNDFTDWFKGPGLLSYMSNTIKAQGIFAGKDYFNVFSYKLLEGDRDKVLSDKKGVVISRELSQKLFGTFRNTIGKVVQWTHTMQLQGPFYVSGIFESPPPNSTTRFDVIFNYENLLDGDSYSKNWNATYAETYLIVKKGANIEAFRGKIADILKSKHAANNNSSLSLQQYSRKYLYGRFENGREAGGRIAYVKMFSIVGIFIILIACINFMNLSTAQASRRMKEIGVRKAIGANQTSLVFQLLGESLMMTSVALIISVILIMFLLPEFNRITGKDLRLSFDLQLVIPLISIAAVTGFLAGCYPAFYISRFNPVNVLKGKLRTTLGELWVRKGLVIMQFSVSIIFIVGFLVVNKQLDFTQSQNLGYNKDNVLSFRSEGKIDEANFETFITEVKKIPGVVNASSMFGSILKEVGTHTGFSWNNQSPEQKQIVFTSPMVSYDFVETLGIEVKEGRSFSRKYGNEKQNVMLNEAAVQFMNIQNPIGKNITYGSDKMQIIGVVQNFHYGSLHDKLDPVVLLFAPYTRDVLVKIKAGTERETIDRLTKTYEQFHPKYPFEFTFMDDDYKALYAAEQRVGVLSRYFAGLAIIISCIGLFGLAAFTAQRRKKEIGVRKIVGASVSDVVMMLLVDFIKLVIISIIIALPVAWVGMNSWLNEFAYKININGWILAIAAIAALFVAMATVSFHAIKAALTNPVKTVRME